MLCSHCHNKEATHGVDGEDGLPPLCDDCFARLGEAAGYFGSDAGLFVSFMQPETSEGVCPACGTALSDYARTGLLGCAECYEAFREQLRPAVRRIHGRTVHTGKHPCGDGKMYELLDERKRLRGELERAVREKRMKDAERINRDIRDISRMLYRDDYGGEG